jgi:hypothetical protein
VRARNDVPEVLDHAIRDERFTVVVEVEPPRIRGAMSDRFEDPPGRVVAPHAAVEEDPLPSGRAGLADVRIGLDTVAAIEPAIRSPGETVEDVVPGLLDIPTVKDDDRRAIRLVIPIAIRDEDEIGSTAQPDAAEANSDARKIRSFVIEDGAAIETAIAIGILEDHDAVRAFLSGGPVGIRQAFDDPKPPAVIEGKRDGLHYVGLAGEEGCAEPLGQRHPARCFLCWNRPIRGSRYGSGEKNCER